MPRLRIYDSPNVHALTTNLYYTPTVQRYLKLSKKSRFVPHVPKIELKLFWANEKYKASYELIYAENLRLQVLYKRIT